MCRRITCPECKRPSFAGCGAHVEQVLGDVAPADRCRCHEKPKAAEPRRSEGAEKPPVWAFWRR
ncbi:MAG: hypothetical protein U0414_23440 [Polyangiaceae bacterium]